MFPPLPVFLFVTALAGICLPYHLSELPTETRTQDNSVRKKYIFWLDTDVSEVYTASIFYIRNTTWKHAATCTSLVTWNNQISPFTHLIRRPCNKNESSICWQPHFLASVPTLREDFLFVSSAIYSHHTPTPLLRRTSSMVYLLVSRFQPSNPTTSLDL